MRGGRSILNGGMGAPRGFWGPDNPTLVFNEEETTDEREYGFLELKKKNYLIDTIQSAGGQQTSTQNVGGTHPWSP